MSLVTPIPQATDIRLYGNVGWDNTYKNIRLFDTKEQREQYLAPLQVDDGQFNTCSVVRMGKSIRLTGRINDFIGVTYMSFTNYGVTNASNDPTYYAFVTDVDYVNVNAVELTFEIDWIQTYLFDFEFESCFVEREHVDNDELGLWTASEGIDTGEYVINSTQKLVFPPAVMLSLLTSSTETLIYGNVATVAYSQGYTMSQLGVLDDVLSGYNDRPERVAQMCMIVAPMTNGAGEITPFSQEIPVNRANGFANNQDEAAYIPRNQKLNGYPFKLITIDNFMGEIEQLRYENFANPSLLKFQINGNPLPKPCMECVPMGYKGVTENSADGNIARQFSVEYSNFPQVPYATDTFKQWVAQEGFVKGLSVAAQVAVSSASVGLAAGGGALTAVGAAWQAGGAIGNILNYAQEIHEHSIHNRQMHNSIGNAGLNFANYNIGFRVTQYGIRKEMAQRIDKYFDRYGYYVGEVKKPNIRGRQYVNYAKTVGAQVAGAVPDIARRTMEKALDSGVSFWHTNGIGQPLASNPIVST